MTAFSLIELLDTIPTPVELLDELRLGQAEASFIQASRKTIQAILHGRDPRLLMIVGPCSIHDLDSGYEYAEKFAKLSEEVKSSLFLVMRTYFEKARTLKGWKGYLYDPFLDGSYDMATGLRRSRKFLIDLAAQNIPTGSELLEITTSHYFTDLLSWGCIGARTSASQPHRQLAATLQFPIGFKNSTDGNIQCAINGVLSATLPHVYLGVEKNGALSRIQARGNSDCHIVLRGGDSRPNYDPPSVFEACARCQDAGILQKIIVDCSHGNCSKQHALQIPAFEVGVEQFLERRIGGLMLESYLRAGNQAITSHLKYGVSITDPCLDWETTEFLIKKAHSQLTRRK